jgi:hypothetical protein
VDTINKFEPEGYIKWTGCRLQVVTCGCCIASIMFIIATSGTCRNDVRKCNRAFLGSLFMNVVCGCTVCVTLYTLTAMRWLLLYLRGYLGGNYHSGFILDLSVHYLPILWVWWYQIFTLVRSNMAKRRVPFSRPFPAGDGFDPAAVTYYPGVSLPHRFAV